MHFDGFLDETLCANVHSTICLRFFFIKTNVYIENGHPSNAAFIWIWPTNNETNFVGFWICPKKYTSKEYTSMLSSFYLLFHTEISPSPPISFITCQSSWAHFSRLISISWWFCCCHVFLVASSLAPEVCAFYTFNVM